MSFGIEFTDVAEMEVQDALLWFLGRSPSLAGKWQEGFEKAISSLADFPTRCQLAPEADLFSVPVRQLIYGRYRILFALVDTDEDGELDTVRILHVRHGARRQLGYDD